MLGLRFTNATLHRTLVGLGCIVCLQLGCSFASLDYLKNGAKQDAAAIGLTDEDGPTGVVPEDAAHDRSAVDEPAGAGEAGQPGPAIDGRLETVGIDGSLDVGGHDSSAGIDGGDEVAATGAGGATTDGGAGTGGATGAGGQRGGGGVVGSGGRGGAGSGGTSGGKGGSFGPEVGPEAQPDSQPPDLPATGPSVLFVVGNTSPLGSGDSVLLAHLQANGFSVTSIKDSNVPTNVSQNVVLISRSISSNNLGSKLRNTPKPVLVWEPNLYVDMGMVDNTSTSYGSTGTTAGLTTLVINSAAGALAAGLSSTTTVLDTAADIGYGVPSAQAITVASIPNKPSQWAIFAYESGVQMAGISAPGRRAGFFLSQTAPSDLNTAGWKLFDAMMTWLSR